ncbi:MAG TPA: alpha-amylase family glycosyl hydrolase [Acidimicrobiales bacterium]|nr:alpha-amylase family glycosyl hydrolase [Acidimicrobiales bacterium]
MPDARPRPEDAPWWQGAVVYQIYPRSFADADGDGVGDLEGVRGRLDHLAWLGVDAIWLSPFYRSPMDDFGYDVSDHCDVDPLFGTLEDFDRLVADCHARGIRVIVDWVPNHTSDRHPWFRAARSSPEDPHRAWYVWRDVEDRATPPNNWVASFSEGAPAWTVDERTGQWYLHLFLPSQPDLDWDEPAVEAAMHDVLRFWLDRGVDGFRADVLHAIGKAPGLPDDPPEYIPIPHSALNHVPEVTLPRLHRIRALLEGYDGDRMIVGEVYLLDTEMVAHYYDGGRGIHLSFNFPPLYAAWDATAWRQRVEEVERLVAPVGWPTWVLSNHDNPRHRTRYGSDRRARAAAFLVLGLRGTAFLYAGEELGLADAVVPDDRAVDPGGRDGCRAPIPWSPGPGHGWGTEDPWLPWPPSAATGGDAESLRADPGSILHLYRRLLAARRASPALRTGDQRLREGPGGVLAWERSAGDDRRVVAVNFGAEPADLDRPDLGPEPGPGWAVEVASDGAGEGEPFTGALAPDTAVLLRPAG